MCVRVCERVRVCECGWVGRGWGVHDFEAQLLRYSGNNSNAEINFKRKRYVRKKCLRFFFNLLWTYFAIQCQFKFVTEGNAGNSVVTMFTPCPISPGVKSRYHPLPCNENWACCIVSTLKLKLTQLSDNTNHNGTTVLLWLVIKWPLVQFLQTFFMTIC